ncbi:MAG: glycosyltransferase, partial [Holophaga sp.]|nr:glycosyltransferase [Holophaga sp.]
GPARVHLLVLSDEDLQCAYGGALALAYPSRYEGFGLPILEAMACSCPVITCNNSSIGEVAGDAAIYVSPDDIPAMRKALLSVQQEENRNQMIQKGQERVTHFSWRKMAHLVENALIQWSTEAIACNPPESLECSRPTKNEAPVSDKSTNQTKAILDQAPAPASSRKLHIGGKSRADGWEVLNALPGPDIDHVCNANNLSQFADATFDEIYASHVVEHFDYMEELTATLTEWNRVLVPGGKIYISVPDLDILASLLLEKEKLTDEERFFVMRMMFGGHIDEFDYHIVGLNEVFLAAFLEIAGFVNINRVDTFGLFNDTSNKIYKGVAISLNVTAEKPF